MVSRPVVSVLGVAALAVLLLLAVANTCQLDSLEQQLVATRHAVQDLAQRLPAPRAEGSGGGGPASGLSADEQAILADPANLLQPSPRPRIEADTVVRGGTLRRAVGQDPTGLNPYLASGGNVAEITRYVSDTLAVRHRHDPDLWAPALALRVTTADDGLTYRITLRRGVKWHRPAVDWQSGRYGWLQGEHELTSDDFAFVFDILRNPSIKGRVSSLRGYFEALDSVSVTGPYELEVRFRERLFTNLPALLDLTPLPRWLYMHDEDGERFAADSWGERLSQHWYNNRTLGTGPYRFVVWEPGVRVVLERNADYFGEAPAFDRVLTYVLKDPSAWPRKLKTGELDIIELKPQQYRAVVLDREGPILGRPGIERTSYPSLGYYYIGWNADSPLFADRQVRQAMTHALNRVAVLERVFHGLGTLTTGPFAQQSPCYDASVEPWPFDLAAAAAKLERAGWTDSDGDGIRDRRVGDGVMAFSFDLLIYGSSEEYRALAVVYREDLLRIGVRLNPVALDWATLLSRIRARDFHAHLSAWGLPWDVDLHQLWHSSEADRPKGSNAVGFRNPEADRLIEALRRTFDRDERVRLCHAFHRLVHDEQPYSFLFQRRRSVLYWNHLNVPDFSLVWPHADLRAWSFRVPRP